MNVEWKNRRRCNHGRKNAEPSLTYVSRWKIVLEDGRAVKHQTTLGNNADGKRFWLGDINRISDQISNYSVPVSLNLL